MHVVLSKELLVEFRRIDWKRAQIASTTLSRLAQKHGAVETTIEEGSKRIPGHLVERRPLRGGRLRERRQRDRWIVW